jgi:hypothetical protein
VPAVVANVAGVVTDAVADAAANDSLVTWINIMIRMATAGLTTAYFVTASNTHSFLDVTSATLLNSIGIVLSITACFMSIMSAFFGTELAQAEFKDKYKSSEHLTTTFTNITLFVLLGISSGLTLTGNTSGDLLTTLTIVSIFVSRISLKFEFLLQESNIAESTKMQNILSLLVFGLAIFNDQRENTQTPWVVWLISIAAALQFVFALSKQIESVDNEARLKLEEGTCAVINFVILGLVISQATTLCDIRTVLLILVADIVSRASAASKDTHAYGWDLAIVRLSTALIGGLFIAFASVLLEKDLYTGYMHNIVGILFGTGVLKALVGACALLDSPTSTKTYNMQMYNYLNNGSTSIALLGSVAVLTDAIANSKDEVYPALLLVAALLARATDLFQNAIENNKDGYIESSFNRSTDFRKMSIDHYKVWLVLLSMVASITTLQMEPSDSDDSAVVMFTTVLIAVHLVLVILAMVAGAISDDTDNTFKQFCVSTREVVRLPVATTILGLLTSVAANRPTTMTICTMFAYATADIFGMSLV